MSNKKNTPPPQQQQHMGPMRHGVPPVKPKNMRGTLLRLWDLTKGERNGVNWILLLSIFASASSILSPLLIGNVFNHINNGNPAFWVLIILAGLYVTDWLVRFLQQFFMASIAQKIILHIRKNLFSVMKTLPLSFFDRRQHGELISRLTNDVDNISTTISDSLSQLMVYGFTILGVFTIMMYLNVILTCVSLLAVVLIFILTKTITTRTRSLFILQQSILGKLNGQVEESISGLSMVKAYCREQNMIDQFEKTNEEFCDVATRALIWSGYLMPIMNVINNLNFVAIAVFSGIMAAKGIITIGLISSFLLYSRQFARPFVDIANIYNNFQTAVAGAERIFQILDEPSEPEDLPKALPMETVRGDIELKKVTFGYSPNKSILKDINVSVSAGTRVAIVGPTGAGKTTIINLLTRFYDVTAGSILLDGKDLREYRMKDLRRTFGVVLQDTSLFEMSIKANISYGRENVPFNKIHEAAITSGADSFIRRLPQGYDTVLTQNGSMLSQGERQLLTIARAVLVDAPILILDEATSSVDTVTEQKIRSAMLAITKGRTSFIIAHRLSTIRDSDLIVLIEKGRIAEQGTHNTLMAINGQYAAMYRTQLGLE
ncbi:MAG TPA: ABC transporter ATP-binding protein [Treponemataceae bacterium]|nr:ABC transporter ATP-binding protein [Treponemataceae bacterium]